VFVGKRVVIGFAIFFPSSFVATFVENARQRTKLPNRAPCWRGGQWLSRWFPIA